MPFWKRIFKSTWIIIKETVDSFSDDRGVKMSASLSYSTIFSLPPLLMLIISIAGAFFNKENVQHKMYQVVGEWVGKSTARQIIDTISAIDFHKNNVLATYISIGVLTMAATGIFVEIQDSLNIVWGVRTKSNKSILKLLLNRLISFLMILGLGALSIVLLIANTIVIAAQNFIEDKLPWFPLSTLLKGNNIGLMALLMLLFTITFKTLPDVKVRLRYIWPGALLTTLLFWAGKFIIGLYVQSSTMVSVYGAAGSLIVLLLWIYYSAMIFYIGAEFVRAYALYNGAGIIPKKYAEYDDKVLVEEYEKEKGLRKDTFS